MQKIFLLLLLATSVASVKAQHIFNCIVKDKATGEPISGVTVSTGQRATVTNDRGLATLSSIAPGRQVIVFSYSGYTTRQDTLVFPLTTTDTLVIDIESREEELDEVVVQSTRTGRTIKNTPTRVETIDGEELDEKNNMRPANVSMLLHESTGLQVQQTSATSANASIRVQGLDGRYTQLLKDGYPNFGNFASGLSILEIPPLDLRQVEVIKGPSSTLYGGGAIAGVINFISKMPKTAFEGDFILNQSNIGQTNIGGYIAQKRGKLGYSLLALANTQRAFDVDEDGFSELPRARNITVTPRLFWYPNASTTVQLTNSFTRGTNLGGDMEVIRGKPSASHVYFEKNTTQRNTTTIQMDKHLGGRNRLTVKQSLALFNRTIQLPDYLFDGANTNAFTDASLLTVHARHTLITGLNLVYDRFVQRQTPIQNARTVTAGIYVQDTWDITPRLTIESGLRIDHMRYSNTVYAKRQVFVLPRVSALFKITDRLNSRIGGGLGYKAPTLFTEETERMQYQAIAPPDDVSAEQSIGATADVNYTLPVGNHLRLSVNQLFFYTRISQPLILQRISSGSYFFSNQTKPVISKGFETNLKFIYREDLKLFVGYTFTDARASYLTTQNFLPLVPKHKVNLTLMYEKEDNFKIGLESYFTGQQYLSNGTSTPSFWEWGFMAQKTFQAVSFFINFENFTDQRQSRYKGVVNPPLTRPGFDEIWNHTEGFVINGGVKLKL